MACALWLRMVISIILAMVWFGYAIASVVFATSAFGVIPAMLLQKTWYELALSGLGLPAGVMALLIFSVAMTRILTGTGDTTKRRTNDFLTASSNAIRNHFEQTLLFAVNLICYTIHGRAETVVLFAVIFTLSRFEYWFGYFVFPFFRTMNFSPFILFGVFISTYMMI